MVDSAACALPSKFFRSAGKDQSKLEELRGSFDDEVMSEFLKLAKSTKKQQRTAASVLKQVVDQVCEERADGLDKELYRGKKGMF